jgi:hypothetical protein
MLKQWLKMYAVLALFGGVALSAQLRVGVGKER